MTWIRGTSIVAVLLLFVLSISGNSAGASPAATNTSTKTPDPCVQALTPDGHANGLHKRCHGVGGGGGAAKGDFNGDGFADLAVGVPHEDVGGVTGVGAVNIIYGSASGLTATADQVLYETTFGYSPAAGDHFGFALASGDFNHDGFSDLAIGMPDKNVGSFVNAGKVLVINGSALGLDNSTAATVPLLPQGRGRAGAALVWADFNADGYGDLAIGVPTKAIHFGGVCTLSYTVANGGEVEVLYGSATGLSQFGAQAMHAGVRGDACGSGDVRTELFVGDDSLDGDQFGSALAAGDFNNDSVADLAVGVPLNDTYGTTTVENIPSDAGVVHLVPGSRTGLVARRAQVLLQGTNGVAGAAEEGDQFGRAVVSGDFNGDGWDDLAVGVPFEDLVSNSRADAGAVQVFFGATSDTGLVLTNSSQLFLSQEVLSGTAAEPGDRFGWAIAAGNFDGDSAKDLVVGVPGEDLGAVTDGGLVHVLYGTASGLSLSRTQIWTQDSSGVPDVAEVGDQFGYALSAWNFGKSSQSDLAIGVPFEDLVSAATGTEQVDAGAVNVIYGTAPGSLTGSGGLNSSASNFPQFWHQDVSGIEDAAEPGDHFGEALY